MSQPKVNTQVANTAPRTLDAQLKQAREAATAALIVAQRKAKRKMSKQDAKVSRLITPVHATKEADPLCTGSRAVFFISSTLNGLQLGGAA